ncbi:MAG TPA: excinuclease ABC subunit UvrC [Vicinamibacterales bacterium]|nr:excinuclease ABC subunit UvrC [Vicinamibacterales bacterium]
MPVTDLKARIARLPEQPGVYIFYGAGGETLYVGKARVLRDRVRSYLGAQGVSPRVDALLDEAQNLEVIVTDSVVEALALENHLIKQRQPKYNVLLRDDKNYPYLQLTTTEPFPRLLVARRVERDGNVYAGPFLPASLARRTMSLAHRLFGLRSCNEHIDGRRGRPCLEYDIGRCLAPCVAELCSPERYAQAVADARLFLEGRNEELAAALRARMLEAAEAEAFERAAQLRDAVATIEALATRQQKMSTPALGDRDAFGVKTGAAGAVVEVFQMRRGRVIDRVELAAEAGGQAEADVLEAAVQQFYETREPPPEIHLPVALSEAESIAAWLSDRAGRRVRVVVPRRGEKRALVELAMRNAAVGYQARFGEGVAANYEALEGLRAALGLAALPRRIECVDVSTIQGAETVAAVVVCEDGRLRRGEYRRFRIRGDLGEPGAGRAAAIGALHPDDFAAMHETVFRRCRRLLEQGGPFPDLVVVDGGRGQLSAAYAAFARLGLENLVAVGLAKREELVYTRDRPDPIALPPGGAALRLLQRLRDEAHRFAVTFHRRARAMRDLRSELDLVPGIGPRRRRALLARFGSVAGVRRATREELVQVVGRRAADAILAHFAANA